MHFAEIKEAEPDQNGESPEGGTEEVAEPKRKFTRSTAVLAGLVAAAVGGLWLMHARSGPTTAQAAAESIAAEQTINTFLGDGKKNVANMQIMLSNTEKVVDQFKQFPAAAQVPLEELQKNPFSDAEQAASKPTGATYDTRQRDRDAALEKARKLQIQSIMYGQSQRACMVGGKFLSEGDQFDGFTVERVNADSVIVKQSGFRFELKLQR
jgi:hypothetical protein